MRCFIASVFALSTIANAVLADLSGDFEDAVSRLRTIGVALQAYQDDHGTNRFPGRLTNLVALGYLNASDLLCDADPSHGTEGGTPDPFFLGWATNDIPVNWLEGHGLGTNQEDIVGDQDGDGSETWQEFNAGTNPTNAASVLSFTGVETNASGLVLEWRSEPFQSYRILSCSNLSQNQWGQVGSECESTPPVSTMTITQPSRIFSAFKIAIRRKLRVAAMVTTTTTTTTTTISGFPRPRTL